MKSKWYQFVGVDSDMTELLIYGDIEDYKWSESDVTAYDFADDLSKIETQNLRVRINSYGGSVSSGLAIYNLLKTSSKHIITQNDGFACSAASVIFMAGDERIMPKTSLLMIHNAWTYGYGNANDFRKMAEDLDKVTLPSLEAYKSVSSLNENEIKDLMDKESWLTAEQSLEYGFATKITDDAEPQQSINCEFYLRKAVMQNKELDSHLQRLSKENEELKQKLETKPTNSWEGFF